MQERYLPAFEVFDAFLNGDFFPYPTFYNNATGLYDYFNFDTPYYPPNPYDQFMDVCIVLISQTHLNSNFSIL